jgi:hypothetical protein
MKWVSNFRGVAFWLFSACRKLQNSIFLTGAMHADRIGPSIRKRENNLMPAATTNSAISPDIIEHRVFVLELDGLPKFAFAAAEISSADEIARSAWFGQAFDRFCPDRRVKDSTTRLRPATEREASTFHDVAEEFAEPTAHFLVAHLPGLDG